MRVFLISDLSGEPIGVCSNLGKSLSHLVRDYTGCIVENISFSFADSPMGEVNGLISFNCDTTTMSLRIKMIRHYQ